ncbi:MAG TPA: GtrA family protein [Candidatus Dormibacteraeota bacterium]|nr:GtrA family protein [Candidatus Dormibacteraeota bacterium]
MKYEVVLSALYGAYERRLPEGVRMKFAPFVNSPHSLGLFLNYIWIGIVGEAILFAAFWLLLAVRMERLLALAISYTVAVSAQFVFNKYCNFRSFDRTIVQQAGTYVIITGVVYLVSVAVIEVSVRLFHLTPILGLLLTVPICLPIGYLGNRYLTFGPGILLRSLERFERMKQKRRGRTGKNN